MPLSGFHWSTALDVNDDGVVVGITSCVAGETLTFRWSELEGMEQLARFEDGYPIIAGQSINESGTIAALFDAAFITSSPQIASRPILWTADDTRIDLAPATECESQGEPPCLGAWTGHFINDRDVVAGNYAEGAYRWTARTGLVYLPALGTNVVVGLNSHGDILAAGSEGALLLRKSGQLWEISGIVPTALNDKREVVGGALNGLDVNAALWTRGKGVQLLGTLGGDYSMAYDINDEGEVVGTSTNAAGETRAFYWTRKRGMVDLGPGIAYAISDAGHIVGSAPSGIFPPDMGGLELWQAAMWQGTAGVESPAIAARDGGKQASRGSRCFADKLNWQSKTRMSRCMADQ